jgi:D-lactate dehydrogenase
MAAAAAKTPKIVFLETDKVDAPSVAEHFPEAECRSEALDGAELVAACKDAAIVSVFLNCHFTKDVIAQLPDLKLICTRTVGFDHIDLETCKQRGIVVTNVPDYGSHVISEHVFAMILSAFRHVYAGQQRMAAGQFDYHGLRGISLHGKTIGIAGTGKIGRGVAEIAHGFGMQIIACDIFQVPDIVQRLGVRYVSFEELLKQADIISVHLPSTKQTYHCLNRESFATMKPGVTLVNTARGDLIDSVALKEALDADRVHLALLDVLEHEKDFEENKALITHPKVITTPHIAFYADDSMRNMYSDCITSIKQFLSGATVEHEVKPIVKIPAAAPGVRL